MGLRDLDQQITHSIEAQEDDQPSICSSDPSRAAVLHAALPAMGRYSHQPGKNHCCIKACPVPAGTPSGRFTPLYAHTISPPFAALTMGRTSFPGGLSALWESVPTSPARLLP